MLQVTVEFSDLSEAPARRRRLDGIVFASNQLDITRVLNGDGLSNWLIEVKDSTAALADIEKLGQSVMDLRGWN